MSYQDQSGVYPPQPPLSRDPRDPREQHESQYPPPPGEEDDRARAYHQRGPSTGGVNLPSMPHSYDASSYPPAPNGYAPDPRAPYHQDPYRAPPGPPFRDDRGAYPPNYGRGGSQHMAFSQSAPRQRTAIACRYCRRRKIRCSGFDQNPEGRCSNCQRFQQDCIFTPVSSQAQAFVPAHALYPEMRGVAVGTDGQPRPVGQPGRGGFPPPGTPLYGAHGQPLGSVPNQSLPTYEYPAPSPTSSYNSYTDDRAPPPGRHSLPAHSQPTHHSQLTQHSQPPSHTQSPHYSQPPHHSQPAYAAQPAHASQSTQQGQDQSRKRTQPGPHPTILPPPMPNQPSYARSEGSTGRRQAAEDDLRLPAVTPTGAQTTSNYSPGSSTSSHSNLQPPQQSGLPSMSRTPPLRKTSPAEARSDPMALGSIMERRPDTEIDRNMLGRLGRKN